MMVAGGTSLFGEKVASVEIYDSAIDSWYFSEDLPENPDSGYNIWKFEEGAWSQLDSSLTVLYYYEDFLPDDFIPDC